MERKLYNLNFDYYHKVHIVQYSGGIGSFAVADIVKDRLQKREKMVLLFADTRMEDEDLYRFLVDSSQYLNCPIIRLQDGRDPWEVFFDEKL